MQKKLPVSAIRFKNLRKSLRIHHVKFNKFPIRDRGGIGLTGVPSSGSESSRGELQVITNESQNPILYAATVYLRRGMIPVYIQPGTKCPSEKGWQQTRPTETELVNIFKVPCNIGLLLGAPSNGLVDVDLDCREARELADKYLLSTPSITGRASAPRSHRWYYAPGAITRQFRDPITNQMVIELRSTGAQTLVGPSIHPESGEVYDYLIEEPTTIDAATLLQAVEKLFSEVIRLRYPTGIPQMKRVPHLQSKVSSGLTNNNEEVGVITTRAIGYLSKLPPAISGHGGHAATFAAATALVHGFGLHPQYVLELLLTHYNPHCQPPWAEEELRHKVEDAAGKPHGRPYGWLLDQEGGSESIEAIGDPPTCRGTSLRPLAYSAVEPGWWGSAQPLALRDILTIKAGFAHLLILGIDRYAVVHQPNGVITRSQAIQAIEDAKATNELRGNAFGAGRVIDAMVSIGYLISPDNSGNTYLICDWFKHTGLGWLKRNEAARRKRKQRDNTEGGADASQ